MEITQREELTANIRLFDESFKKKQHKSIR